MDHLLSEIIDRANRYQTELPNRRVSPAPDSVAGLKQLDVPLQDHPIKPATVLAELDDIGSKATVACAGGRYFGFVTGAFDPAEEICLQGKEAGAWVHVDGAFGLWAAATPQKSALAKGVEHADSWATDAHKWLNVPYDSGLVFVREARHLLAAMASHAAYLIEGEKREPSHCVPEMSRRARGFEIWSALRSLGRTGLSDLIERCCKLAARFAAGLQNPGHEVLNEVVLNQVLVKFGDEEQTRQVIQRIQAEGTCWCGETKWQGQVAMRISVSSWATTADDVEISLAAILRIADQVTERAII